MAGKNKKIDPQLEQIAKAQGAKLAFLISALDASDEVKHAWLDLLPQMTVEQLDRLTEILEVEYAAEQSEQLSTEFEGLFSLLSEKYNGAVIDLNNKFSQKIKKLSSKIK